MIRTTTALTVAAAVASAALAAPPALANEGDVKETGQCSQLGRYDLKLSPQNGRIEVEFEVDVNRRGQRYRVKMFQDGRRIERGVYTSRGPSGSFTVRAVRPDHGGVDGFRAKAFRVGGGNRCGGSARF